MTTTYAVATVYVSGMFGYTAHEAKNVTVEEAKYAQYASAQHVHFVPKGKRKARGFTHAGINSRFIVVEGHGHPAMRGWLDAREDGSNVSRYGSCDPRWESDFNAWLASTGMVVAFDGRGTTS